jgi:hypothetical protein
VGVAGVVVVGCPRIICAGSLPAYPTGVSVCSDLSGSLVVVPAVVDSRGFVAGVAAGGVAGELAAA